MNIETFAHGTPHLMGGGATHPIELRCGTLAALLLVAGSSQPPCRALPTHRITAHSDTSNYRF